LRTEMEQLSFNYHQSKAIVPREHCLLLRHYQSFMSL